MRIEPFDLGMAGSYTFSLVFEVYADKLQEGQNHDYDNPEYSIVREWIAERRYDFTLSVVKCKINDFVLNTP